MPQPPKRNLAPPESRHDLFAQCPRCGRRKLHSEHVAASAQCDRLTLAIGGPALTCHFCGLEAAPHRWGWLWSALPPGGTRIVPGGGAGR